MSSVCDAPYYRWQQHTLLLFCHLQPNASSDAFVGAHGDRLKIRISATPVDGRANSQLIRFIAEHFAVAKSAVSIRSGAQSRQKTVQVQRPLKIPAQLEISAQP